MPKLNATHDNLPESAQTTASNADMPVTTNYKSPIAPKSNQTSAPIDTVATSKVIEKRKLTDLKPHPSQAALFNDMSEEDLHRLAEDIERNGLDHEVEILPDGTIICGHQRARAAQLLGWTEIACWVRQDLAERGVAWVEERLISDNLQRRQLDPLDKARCYKRLRDLMQKQRTSGQRDMPVWQKGTLRDFIGTMLGCSGKKLDRLVKILDAPPDIQRAYQEGKLRQVDAERVGRMPQAAQKVIVSEIKAGAYPQGVVNKYIKNQVGSKDRLAVCYRNFVKSLNNGLGKFSEHVASIKDTRGTDLDVFDRGIQLLQEMKDHVARQVEERSEELERRRKLFEEQADRDDDDEQ